jgi:ABC-2 type transport system permease protein
MTYSRAELLRSLRDRRTFIFSIAFPLILFWVIAAPNKDATDFVAGGVPLPVYYMTTMAGYGAMIAVLAGGARIAGERQLGWTRQLRISPLTPFAYFRTKLGIAFFTAGISVALLYVSGFALDVRLPAGRWLAMTGLIAVALIPFAALGVLLGHLLSVDSMGPAMGGGVGLLALLSGFWFPINSGVVHDICEFLPSWWIVQASHASLGGEGWSAFGWAVVIGWSVALTLGAARAYRRDTGLR